MNQKEVAQIKKQFSSKSQFMKIQDIFNVYVKKEGGGIYHKQNMSFEMLENEQQDMYYDNFKKVLTGKMEQKLFELKVKHAENNTRNILYRGLTSNGEQWQKNMLEIVEKMFKDIAYTMDVVVTFIRAEVRKPTKKRSKDSEEGGDDQVYANQFILCSVNKTDFPKKMMMFDYKEKEYKSNSTIDPHIQLLSPLAGFMFPVFNDNSADVNHILYSAGKANQPDSYFIEEVLNCHDIETAESQKSQFEDILSEVVGERISSDSISRVFEEINHVVSRSNNDEEPMIGVSDLEHILELSGIEPQKPVESVFKDIAGDEHYEMKASSLLPPYESKSLSINTKIVDLKISPKEVKKLRHITHNGKRCLLIEIDEEAVVEGFKLETESLNKVGGSK